MPVHAVFRSRFPLFLLLALLLTGVLDSILRPLLTLARLALIALLF